MTFEGYARDQKNLLFVYLVSNLRSTIFQLSHYPITTEPRIHALRRWLDEGPAGDEVVPLDQYWANAEGTRVSSLWSRKRIGEEVALADHDLDKVQQEVNLPMRREICLPNREPRRL